MPSMCVALYFLCKRTHQHCGGEREVTLHTPCPNFQHQCSRKAAFYSVSTPRLTHPSIVPRFFSSGDSKSVTVHVRTQHPSTESQPSANYSQTNYTWYSNMMLKSRNISLCLTGVLLNWSILLSLQSCHRHNGWEKIHCWGLIISGPQWPSVLLYTINIKNDTNWGGLPERWEIKWNKTQKASESRAALHLHFIFLTSPADMLSCSTSRVPEVWNDTRHMVTCLGLEGKYEFLYDVKLNLEGVQVLRIQSDENRQV